MDRLKNRRLDDGLEDDTREYRRICRAAYAFRRDDATPGWVNAFHDTPLWQQALFAAIVFNASTPECNPMGDGWFVGWKCLLENDVGVCISTYPPLA